MSKPTISKTKSAIDKMKPKINKGEANIDRMFDARPDLDPLADVDYTGDLETDTDTETSALLTGFKERAAREQDRFTLATDSEFWFAVCFQSREQKEAFLSAMDWLTNGDKYLDGLRLASKHDISLPEVQLPNPKGVSKKLKKLPAIGS